MHLAYDFAISTLRDAVAESSQWSEDKFNRGLDFLRLCQACVRQTLAFALEKLDFLICVPYLLARLDQPGVSQTVLEQYGVGAPARHHRVTTTTTITAATITTNASISTTTVVLLLVH